MYSPQAWAHLANILEAASRSMDTKRTGMSIGSGPTHSDRGRNVPESLLFRRRSPPFAGTTSGSAGRNGSKLCNSVCQSKADAIPRAILTFIMQYPPVNGNGFQGSPVIISWMKRKIPNTIDTTTVTFVWLSSQVVQATTVILSTWICGSGNGSEPSSPPTAMTIPTRSQSGAGGPNTC